MKPVDGAAVSAFILDWAIIHFGQHRFDSVWQELTVNHSTGKIVKLAACFGFATWVISVILYAFHMLPRLYLYKYLNRLLCMRLSQRVCVCVCVGATLAHCIPFTLSQNCARTTHIICQLCWGFHWGPGTLIHISLTHSTGCTLSLSVSPSLSLSLSRFIFFPFSQLKL